MPRTASGHSGRHSSPGSMLDASGPRFRQQLAETLASHMAAADIVGRLHIVQRFQARTRRRLPRLNTMAAIMRFAEDNGDLQLHLSLPSAAPVVPPASAVSFIRNLSPVTRQLYDGLMARYRVQAFTVAFLTDTRLIAQVQDKVEAAVAAGTTLREFNKAVSEITSDAGVSALTDWHVETVFRTNVQTSYSVGRLEQMRDPDVTAFMPYWQYQTVGDDRVRPAHALMDGFEAKHDDPVWRIWWPPCGYNCRCTTVPLMREDLTGDAAAADSSGVGRMRSLPDEGFGGLGGIV